MISPLLRGLLNESLETVAVSRAVSGQVNDHCRCRDSIPVGFDSKDFAEDTRELFGESLSVDGVVMEETHENGHYSWDGVQGNALCESLKASKNSKGI